MLRRSLLALLALFTTAVLSGCGLTDWLLETEDDTKFRYLSAAERKDVLAQPWATQLREAGYTPLTYVSSKKRPAGNGYILRICKVAATPDSKCAHNWPIATQPQLRVTLQGKLTELLGQYQGEPRGARTVLACKVPGNQQNVLSQPGQLKLIMEKVLSSAYPQMFSAGEMEADQLTGSASGYECSRRLTPVYV